MSGSVRAKRMAALVRAELGRLLVEEVSDTDLQTLVVTEVQVSQDLKNVFIFYEARSSDAKKVEKALKGAASFFRRKLGENLRLKYVPELHFKLDKHTESVSRLMNLLDSLEQKSDDQ